MQNLIYILSIIQITVFLIIIIVIGVFLILRDSVGNAKHSLDKEKLEGLT